MPDRSRDGVPEIEGACWIRLPRFGWLGMAALRKSSQFGNQRRSRVAGASLPNQSLEPMARSVTPRACARVAPALVMAHH